MQRSCAEHQAILNAVRAKEAERAARLLSEHIPVPQLILESDSALVLASPGLEPDQALPETVLRERE